VRTWTWDKAGPMELRETLSPPSGAAYMRAEALTVDRFFALGSPAYL
jgi:hypothetical protein